MGKHRNRRNRQLAQQLQQIQTQQQNGGNVVVAHAQIEASSFSGPLPHPDILARYDALLPGAAARIVDMAHGQTEHRMALEKRAVGSEITRAYAGIACAMSVSLSVLLSGSYLVLKGHDWAGGTMVTTVMVGVITAFLVGTVQRRKEREYKAGQQASLLRRT